MIKRLQFYIVFAFLLTITCFQTSADSNATIYGYVKETGTGRPYENVRVDIFYADDHSKAVATLTTDGKGYYNTTVTGDMGYDIYVRVGNRNFHRPIYIEGGSIKGVDFEITIKSVFESLTEEGGLWIVVVVAIIILGIILLDQIYLRKRRVMRELELERKKLEERLEIEVDGPEDELMKLKKDRDRIQYMINLTKTKFHKRKLDEESFREIVRDYQKRIIEIETRITELESG
jgi:hypothetical protein